MRPSQHIIDMELEIAEKVDELFPKDHKDRMKALILITMAKELGVQGHADNIKLKQKTFVGKVKACRDSIFNGVECLETDDQYGFFKSDVDIRPSSCTWVKPDVAEHLFKIFANVGVDE